MTLLDLLNVVDENERVHVKYSALHIAKKLKEGNPMINILDLKVKNIETDGCAMLFVEVE